jgi:hypothetical protein
VAVLDQLVGLGQRVTHVDHVEMPDIRVFGGNARSSRADVALLRTRFQAAVKRVSILGLRWRALIVL